MHHFAKWCQGLKLLLNSLFIFIEFLFIEILFVARLILLDLVFVLGIFFEYLSSLSKNFITGLHFGLDDIAFIENEPSWNIQVGTLLWPPDHFEFIEGINKVR